MIIQIGPVTKGTDAFKQETIGIYSNVPTSIPTSPSFTTISPFFDRFAFDNKKNLRRCVAR